MHDASSKLPGALVSVVLALLGCSNAGPAAGAAGGGSSGESGDLGGIFTAESEAIEVHWFNFFKGGYRFTRLRDQLSPQQLDLAEAINIVPSTDDCWEDADEMSIAVAAADTQETFFTNEYTGTCGRDRTLVDFEAVSALLDTVHCQSSQGYSGDSAEEAPNIVPDDGCWHGLFNFNGATPAWWFRVAIPVAGQYRISLDGCGDRALVLDVFESDAVTQVASASDEGKCSTLTHTFTDAGSYTLRIEMLSGVQAGDFFFAVESN